MLKLSSPTLQAALLAGMSTILAWPAAAQHSGHPMPGIPKASSAALPVTAQNAVIVAVPPSIKDTSAFMTLKNTSTKAIKLMGVSTSLAAHAMFMKTTHQQNMMGMTQVTGFVLPAAGTLTLKNDGDHLMLMGLKRPLKVGELIPIVLTASDGRKVTVQATVKKP